MVKERPILFSGEMVRAILDGRKTQTRRVIKPQPTHVDGSMYSWRRWLPFLPKDAHLLVQHCPYGVPGDRLWVRETWRIESFWEGEPIMFGYKDGATMEELWSGQESPNYEDWMERVSIQSTEDCERAGLTEDADGYYRWETGNSPCRWRPSIHMPRWASRIMLEVTGVRVERVQDISEDGVDAEGFGGDYPFRTFPEHFAGDWGHLSMSECFGILWDDINAKRGYGWNVNPWVWVVEFKLL